MTPGGKKLKIRQNLPLIITGLVALGLVGVAAYVHFNRPENRSATDTHVPATHPGAGAAGVNDDGEPNTGSNNTTSPSPTGTSPSPGTSTTDPSHNSTSLAVPTQTFNKSHTPISLSQTDSSQANYPLLDSTCQSVRGATCEIHAVMGSTDITVAGPQTISDTTTGADLPWNAKDKGLTVGVWTIKAVAKSGSQSSTSTSNYSLTVNP